MWRLLTRYQADRNRPAKYGLAEAEEADLQQVRDAMNAPIAGGTDPAPVAAAVRDAIVENRFWILTHPEFNDPISARFMRAVEGRNPEWAVLG